MEFIDDKDIPGSSPTVLMNMCDKVLRPDGWLTVAEADPGCSVLAGLMNKLAES